MSRLLYSIAISPDLTESVRNQARVVVQHNVPRGPRARSSSCVKWGDNVYLGGEGVVDKRIEWDEVCGNIITLVFWSMPNPFPWAYIRYSRLQHKISSKCSCLLLFFFLSVRGTVRRKERCEVIPIAHSLGREYSLEPGFMETVAWFLYEHSYSRPQREGLHLVASTTLGIWSECCHVSGMPGFCGDPHSFPSFR